MAEPVLAQKSAQRSWDWLAFFALLYVVLGYSNKSLRGRVYQLLHGSPELRELSKLRLRNGTWKKSYLPTGHSRSYA